MKKLFISLVILLMTVSAASARTPNYQSQAKAEKEAHNEKMEAARPRGQEESYSASRQLERNYENDANRSKTADERAQTIIDNQYKEAARAKELAGN